MTGVLWAIAAGIGFGIFQTLNRKAGEGLDAIRGTFMLIAVSLVVLVILALFTTDITLLWTMPLGAIAAFGVAGFIHFFLGWTFISISQNQIGAARTGAVVGSMPLFGLVIDLVIYREVFSWQSIFGVFLVVAGVYIISMREAKSTPDTPNFQFPWAGLATAFVWAVSPIFIRMGLDELAKVNQTGTSASLHGVIIGILVNVIAYGLLVWWRRGTWQGKSIPRRAIYWQLVAAIFVALSTWARWIALDLAPVAVVTAIVRISVPVVIVLSLLMLDQSHERVNWRVWIGGAMIVGGAMILTFSN